MRRSVDSSDNCSTSLVRRNLSSKLGQRRRAATTDHDRERTMPIIGYGEDGLTYWALTTRLQDILRALDDNTTAAKCTVFFRPSFGRSGGPESAQFGEFDAILATPKAVHLIESKRDNGLNNGRPVVLREVQVWRHHIFTWLLARWRNRGFHLWDAFRADAQADFVRQFPNRPLAPLDSLLARNLDYILRQLCGNGFGKDTRNVLLYFHRAGAPEPNGIVDGEGHMVGAFTLVPLIYTSLGQSGFFQMAE
jgi:hypothetical protein